jgi:hypothetical protein
MCSTKLCFCKNNKRRIIICGRVTTWASTRSTCGFAHAIFGFRPSMCLLLKYLLQSCVWTRLSFVATRVACFLLTSRGVTCLRRRRSSPPQNRSEKSTAFPNPWRAECSGGPRRWAWKQLSLCRPLNTTVPTYDHVVWLPRTCKFSCGGVLCQLLRPPAPGTRVRRSPPVCVSVFLTAGPSSGVL